MITELFFGTLPLIANLEIHRDASQDPALGMRQGEFSYIPMREVDIAQAEWDGKWSDVAVRSYPGTSSNSLRSPQLVYLRYHGEDLTLLFEEEINAFYAGKYEVAHLTLRCFDGGHVEVVTSARGEGGAESVSSFRISPSGEVP